MTAVDDGGPVYPSKAQYVGEPNNLGLSIRDRFAIEGLQLAWRTHTATTPEEAAALAYRIADAMMLARSAQPENLQGPLPF